MTKKQLTAAQARLEAAQAGTTFTPNGFSATRVQTLVGGVLDIQKREGYSLVLFTDEEDNDWTLGLNDKSSIVVTDETTTIKIAKSKEKQDFFWIVG
jgi:hypothetical protein